MLEVTEIEVINRLTLDNPWWEEGRGIEAEMREWRKRAYFEAFSELVQLSEVRRAVILMGPRQVGKTVMIKQLVQQLIDDAIPPRSILYASLDSPTYIGLPLERLLRLFQQTHGHGGSVRLFVFFDEIQYLKDWEIHLKSLVDTFPRYRFVASGSAAAALRFKSDESGAGRFTDLLLPPLTFAEFLSFANFDDGPIRQAAALRDATILSSEQIAELNNAFVAYLNYGGFPEAAVSDRIRRDFQRFVGSDIVDKVLLRDLPSLYGISDTQELNKLFTTLACNTGNEVSLEQLSKSSGIAKNTLRRYIEYLEAAFLVRRVHRVDHNARRMKRAVTFKVYLTNPSMHAALFGPVAGDAPAMGRLAETAVISQWLRVWTSADRFFHARWKKGEVDFIEIDLGTQAPEMAVEVKWNDRILSHHGEFAGYVAFVTHNDVEKKFVLTRSTAGNVNINDVAIIAEPVSAFCYRVGRVSANLGMRAQMIKDLI